MYIQITTRCNMSCAHCCMNATSKGKNMTWETFKRAIDNAEGECITLGGGEPTLHPQFEKFLLYAIVHCEHVFIVTNGSITDRALMLAKLAKKGVIGAALSQDEWHDPIDYDVVEAFTRKKVVTWNGQPVPPNFLPPSLDATDTDHREIRNVSNKVLRRGRAANEEFVEMYEPVDECACEDITVTPNGDVKQCGCLDAPIIGNVFDGWQMPEESGVCYRNLTTA